MDHVRAQRAAEASLRLAARDRDDVCAEGLGKLDGRRPGAPGTPQHEHGLAIAKRRTRDERRVGGAVSDVEARSLLVGEGLRGACGDARMEKGMGCEATESRVEERRPEYAIADLEPRVAGCTEDSAAGLLARRDGRDGYQRIAALRHEEIGKAHADRRHLDQDRVVLGRVAEAPWAELEHLERLTKAVGQPGVSIDFRHSVASIGAAPSDRCRPFGRLAECAARSYCRRRNRARHPRGAR